MNERGFTLIELLVVLLLVALLASLAAPQVSNSVLKAKESALQQDLYVIRKALDDYYADYRQYPTELSLLVEKRYIRKIPVDPLTGSSKRWQLVYTDNDSGERGIIDIRSSAEGKSINETAYNEW